MNLLAMIFGAAGVCLTLGSYAMRTHRTLTLCGAAGVLSWAAHFAALGVWTPAVVSFIMSLRVASGVWVVHMPTRTRWWITALIGSATVAAAWFTWQGWVSVPSATASLFLAWAGLHLHYAQLRKALALSETLWFVNGWATGSSLAMVCALAALALNLTMIFRERNAARSAVSSPANSSLPTPSSATPSVT